MSDGLFERTAGVSAASSERIEEKLDRFSENNLKGRINDYI